MKNYSNLGGGGTDADAIHDNVAGEIAAVTEKATPVAADLVLIEDSEDSNNKKRVQVGNLPGGGGGGDTVKVSANDTTSDYLGTKLVAGDGVTLTENNDGGNETLSVSATAATNSVNFSTLRASLSANQVDPAAGDAIVFDTVEDSAGSQVSLNASNGQFTVKAGSRYVLWANLKLTHTTGFNRGFAWYNVTDSVEVPGTRIRSISANASADENSQSVSRAVVTPSVDTVYEFRFVDGATGPDVDSLYTWAEVTELPGTTGAGAGGYGSYMRGTLGTAQVDIAANDAVAFDTVEDSKGTAISLNAANGQITVAAGRRYELFATVFLEHSAAFAQDYVWYDVTAGVALAGSYHRNRSTTASAHWTGQHVSKAVVEPSVTTTYELRRDDTLLAGTDGPDVAVDVTTFHVTEMTREGTTSPTSVAAETDHLLLQDTGSPSLPSTNGTFTFDVTIDSGSGDAISYNSGTGQFTLKAGWFYCMYANIRGVGNSTEVYKYRFYDVTNSAYIGVEAFLQDENRAVSASHGTDGLLATIRPSTDITVELRSTDTDSGTYNGDLSKISIVAYGGPKATGSADLDYAVYSLSTDDTVSSAGEVIAFDTVLDSANLSLGVDVVNNRLTGFKANHRYLILSDLTVITSAADRFTYDIFDFTSSVILDQRSLQTVNFNGNGRGPGLKPLVFAPTVDSELELRYSSQAAAATITVESTSIAGSDATRVIVMEMPSAALFVESGVTGNLWSGATRNSSAFDNEFESADELSEYTAQQGGFATAESAATFSQNTIDTYDTTFTSGTDVRTTVNPATRPSWWLVQPPADSNAYAITKPVTLPTNVIIVARMKANLRNASQTNNDASIGLMFGYDNGGGLVDTNGSAHGFISPQETDAGTVQANLLYSADGTSTTINAGSTDIDQSGNPYNMVALHKVGTTYYAWAGTDAGNWLFLDSFVQATPFDRIGLYVSNATNSSPGPHVLGVDYIRFIETDTFLL